MEICSQPRVGWVGNWSLAYGSNFIVFPILSPMLARWKTPR